VVDCSGSMSSRPVYGVVATLVGLALLLAAPGMPGVECLTSAAATACRTDPTTVGGTLFVVLVGLFSATVGGWSLLAAGR